MENKTTSKKTSKTRKALKIIFDVAMSPLYMLLLAAVLVMLMSVEDWYND